MSEVLGTQGYAESIDHFFAANESIDFYELHQSILDVLPVAPAKVLDVGAGSGRDAAALAAMGHAVVAIEPVADFIRSAQRLHPSSNIEWRQDSLPEMSSLIPDIDQFKFILCQGVWQHLDDVSRRRALHRVAALLSDDGVFALALRHGPAAPGAYACPIDTAQVLADARENGLRLMRMLEAQPSVIAGKSTVTWSRLVFSKR